MKQLKNMQIIGIDNGYGNLKTASGIFPASVLTFDHEPACAQDLLIYMNLLSYQALPQQLLVSYGAAFVPREDAYQSAQRKSSLPYGTSYRHVSQKSFL